MYHLINTIHPKNEEKRSYIAGFTLLIGLVFCGYVMIGMLVLTHDAIIKIHNNQTLICK